MEKRQDEEKGRAGEARAEEARVEAAAKEKLARQRAAADAKEAQARPCALLQYQTRLSAHAATFFRSLQPAVAGCFQLEWACLCCRVWLLLISDTCLDMCTWRMCAFSGIASVCEIRLWLFVSRAGGGAAAEAAGAGGAVDAAARGLRRQNRRGARQVLAW